MNKKAMSKTVIYATHAILAPLTKQAVKEAQVDQITQQMPYSAVVEILSGDGAECSRTALPDNYESHGTIRRWGNQDGSCIQISFDPADKVAGYFGFFEAN